MFLTLLTRCGRAYNISISFLLRNFKFVSRLQIEKCYVKLVYKSPDQIGNMESTILGHFFDWKQQLLRIIQILEGVAVAALWLEGSIWIKAEELLRSMFSMGWLWFIKSVVYITQFPSEVNLERFRNQIYFSFFPN